MRGRLVALVIATTSLVLVAFLVPLALLVRTAAADRAVSAAVVQAQSLAPTVASLDRPALVAAVTAANAGGDRQIAVFLPGGVTVGAPVRPTANVTLAAAGTGRSLTADVAGGREVLVAVAGLPGGTAVIRTFVSDADMHRGVARAWAVLGGLGLGLLLVSVLVADLLARAVVRPLAAVAGVSDLLAGGRLDARATVGGPPEVRAVASGLNRLATRIGELLARERETVADLSHRLRTPLTALRIDAESLADPTEQARLMADVDALQRTVDDVIRAARRPASSAAPICDAVRVVSARVAFWSALAEEEGRPMEIDVPAGPVRVRVDGDELSACVDALLGNVFAHTPEGCAFAVRLERRPDGTARLTVRDDGPGLPEPPGLRRGLSSGGSTGLGLDIVHRTAADSGGGVVLGNAPGAGAVVTVDFGPAVPGQPSLPYQRSGGVPAHPAGADRRG